MRSRSRRPALSSGEDQHDIDQEYGPDQPVRHVGGALPAAAVDIRINDQHRDQRERRGKYHRLERGDDATGLQLVPSHLAT